MSLFGKRLSDALGSPDDWEVSAYKMKHKPTGTYLWHANGAWFFDAVDRDTLRSVGALGWIERHFLYRKARRVMDAVRANRFSEKGGE